VYLAWTAWAQADVAQARADVRAGLDAADRLLQVRRRRGAAAARRCGTGTARSGRASRRTRLLRRALLPVGPAPHDARCRAQRPRLDSGRGIGYAL
jgi:hypothetical protein